MARGFYFICGYQQRNASIKNNTILQKNNVSESYVHCPLLSNSVQNCWMDLENQPQHDGFNVCGVHGVYTRCDVVCISLCGEEEE